MGDGGGEKTSRETSPLHGTVHTHLHLGVIQCSQSTYWHVFGWWEETRELSGNPHGYSFCFSITQGSLPFIYKKSFVKGFQFLTLFPSGYFDARHAWACWL